MSFNLKPLRGLAAFSFVLLSGCSLGTVGEVERHVEGQEKDASRLLDQARQPLPAVTADTVSSTDGIWTSGIARRSEHGEPLPRKWETSGVTLFSASPWTIFEIGTAITRTTGIPVNFSADVFGDAKNSSSGDVVAANGPNAPVNGVPAPGTSRADVSGLLNNLGLGPGGNISGASGNVIRAVTGTRTTMKVNNTGKLSTFLDQMSSYFGVTWEYSQGQISVFRNVTRTYRVEALPSTVQISSTLDAGSSTSTGTSGGTGASGGGGDSGGSTQSAKSDVSVKIWDQLSSGVQTIVGDSGRVNTAVNTGTITVTAPVDVIRKVQGFVDGQNARLGKQVTVSVEVLNVQLNDSDNISTNIDAIFSKSSKYGFSLGNAVGGAALTAGTPGASVGILSPTSAWKGSTGVLDALSEKGRVSILNTASVTTLNGIPAPLQVSNTRGYLYEIQVTANGGTGSNQTQTQLTPGTVTTGFNLSVLPTVEDDGSAVMMQFAMNISSLNGKTNGFDSFTENGQTIQLENKNSNSFVQQAMVPNGKTIAVTGYQQQSDNSDKQGMGVPDNLLLGGSQNGSKTRNVIVVLVTPVVVDSKQMISTN